MRNVTIVIPSYNRGHIIGSIINSYYQENVKEIIVVNDCSTDNTKDILEEIQNKYDYVKVINNEINIKQAASKNKALKVVSTKYVYFGDDDSYIEDNCISSLLSVLVSDENIGLVAANAIYLDDNNKPILRLSKNSVTFPNMSVNYTRVLEKPIDSIFCPACFIIETSLALDSMFDEKKYIGNGFREETDFVLSIRRKGLKTILHGGVAQINLPRSLSSGGSHAIGGIIYEYYCIRNTYLFLKKHISYLVKIQPYSFSRLFFSSSLLRFRNLLSKNKKIYFLYKKIKG